MAVGYFISLGDKTTCNGTVIEGDTCFNVFGFAHAREGHQVTCGVTGKAYPIIGGIPRFSSNGRLAAGTLHSLSSCPCRAQLIPSLTHMTYDYTDESPPAQAVNSAITQPGGDSRWTFNNALESPANDETQAPDIERCSGCFQLVDQSGSACGTHRYALLRNGSCLAGDVLNEEGYSHICYSANATDLNIAISAPAPILE